MVSRTVSVTIEVNSHVDIAQTELSPLIKWTGGKSSEFKYIESMVPKFDTYVEPFFGGGAVYFALKPTKAIINDMSSDLMEFYHLVKGEEHEKEFKHEMYAYADNWERLDLSVQALSDDLVSLYSAYKIGKIDENELERKIQEFSSSDLSPAKIIDKEFAIDSSSLTNEIEKNILSKIRRIKRIEEKDGPEFDLNELGEHVETAMRSGFYMHFRNILNENKRGHLKLSEPKRIANYYFIRELCYGSMFRFNKSGDFNIPYGGIAYNRKNLRKKVDQIFSKEVHQLFKGTTIENLDFEQFFQKHPLSKDDFVFLDPPYDSDFSEYDLNPFTKEDQARLAKVLLELDAKFILIIKNTPFILQLYSNHSKIKIKSFEKSYLYNVRGRNARETEHLIISNF